VIRREVHEGRPGVRSGVFDACLLLGSMGLRNAIRVLLILDLRYRQ
jgi:hypothetical protein